MQISSSITTQSSLDSLENLALVPSVTIFIHGVYTKGEGFLPLLEKAPLDDFSKRPPTPMPLLLRFTWGDYVSQKGGGNPLYAVDEVHQMFKNPSWGYDRLYQGHAAIRLKELIDACNAQNLQVNIVAHSNGTMLTIGALLLGAEIDNFVLMGSPLDCDNIRSQNELAEASKKVRGRIYNLWNHRDAWATIKGGIGAFGDNNIYVAKNPQIYNIPFVHGHRIFGYKVYSYHEESRLDKINPVRTMQFHHSDYFRTENLPIIWSFVEEFLAKANQPQIYPISSVKSLIEQADWTKTLHFQEKKNISLLEEIMKKYEKAIAWILQGEEFTKKVVV